MYIYVCLRIYGVVLSTHNVYIRRCIRVQHTYVINGVCIYIYIYICIHTLCVYHISTSCVCYIILQYIISYHMSGRCRRFR